jgi:cysteinyl-tRNA synthetase
MANGKMMSGQSNNLVTLRELLQKGYSGRELRYFLLRTHYRKPLKYSLKSLEAACKALRRLDTFIKKLLVIKSKKRGQDIQPLITDMTRAFDAAMDNDLNISMALAALFGFMKKANSMVDMQALDAADVDRLLIALKRIDQVLGVLDFARDSADEGIEVLIRQRDDARKSKDWKQADNVRDLLLNRHIVILDTPVGPIWNRMHG